jgi:hypothetical protein
MVAGLRMVHAALLLLMLEAVTTDLVHHQPEAQPQNLQLSKLFCATASDSERQLATSERLRLWANYAV